MMIEYLTLRLKIYQHGLKQMLSSFASIATFLALILHVAIPAVILTPLITLSVIAEQHTPFSQRIVYQWCYLLLLYLLIRVQKKAILAVHYQHYLACLPITKLKQQVATLILTLVAGNVPLLCPLFLLLYIPDWNTLISQVHFPLFTLSIGLMTWLALLKNHFPWISLLLMPAFLLPMSSDLLFDAAQVNLLALTCIVMDLFCKSSPWVGQWKFPLQYYWQIRWMAIVSAPVNLITRLFFSCLLLALVVYVESRMLHVASDYIQVLICWLLALIIGTYQFDNEAFYQEYSLYLNSLLHSASHRYLCDIFPALLIAIFSAAMLYFQLRFSLVVCALLPVGSLISVISVSKFQHKFYILPSIFFSFCLGVIY